MGSPFDTAEGYVNAEGAFHSFVGSPFLGTICLILSVLITLWFLYRSFTLH
ncbi:MAG: hypothetical protein ACPW61_04305 [Methyloligella sp. ZOD6]